MSDFYSKWYKTPSTKGTSKMSDEQKKKRKQDLYNAALERDAVSSSYAKNYDTQTITDATKLWAKSNVATGNNKYSSYDKVANSVDKKVQSESKKKYDDWLKLGSYEKDRAKSLGIDTSKPFNQSDITMAERMKAFNDAKEIKAKKNEPNKAIKGFDNLIDKGLKKSAPTLQKIGKGISKTSDFMEKNDSVTKDILDALSWAGEKVIRPTMNVANNLTDDKKGVQLLQALKDGVKKDGKQKSTGEDVFRNLGVDGKYLPKILGSGTEMLLDPTNLIPLGMVRKVDKVKDVAKATTVVDDAIKQVEQSNLPPQQKEVAKQQIIEEAQRIETPVQSNQSQSNVLALPEPQSNPRTILNDVEQVLRSPDRANIISGRLNAKFNNKLDDFAYELNQTNPSDLKKQVPQSSGGNIEEMAQQLTEDRSGLTQAIEEQYQLIKRQRDESTYTPSGHTPDSRNYQPVSTKPEWMLQLQGELDTSRVPNYRLKEIAREQVINGYNEQGVDVPGWNQAKENPQIKAIDEQIAQVEDMIAQNPTEREALLPYLEGLKQDKINLEVNPTNDVSTINDLPVTDKVKEKPQQQKGIDLLQSLKNDTKVNEAMAKLQPNPKVLGEGMAEDTLKKVDTVKAQQKQGDLNKVITKLQQANKPLTKENIQKGLESLTKKTEPSNPLIFKKAPGENVVYNQKTKPLEKLEGIKKYDANMSDEKTLSLLGEDGKLPLNLQLFSDFKAQMELKGKTIAEVQKSWKKYKEKEWVHIAELESVGETVTPKVLKQYKAFKEHYPEYVGNKDFNRHFQAYKQGKKVQASVTKTEPIQNVDELIKGKVSVGEVATKTKDPAKLIVNHVDDLYHLSKADDEAYKLARNTRGTSRSSEYIMKHGFVDGDGNVVDNNSLQSIVQNYDGDLNNLREVSIALRVQDYDNLGIEAGLGKDGYTSKQVADAILKQKGDKKTVEAARKLVEYNQTLTRLYGEDFVPDVEKMIEDHPNYTPMYRVQKGGKGHVASKDKIANQKNPINQLTGASNDSVIIDPIESTVKRTNVMVHVAKRNNVMKRLVEVLQDGEQPWGKIIGETDYKGFANDTDAIASTFGDEKQSKATNQALESFFGDGTNKVYAYVKGKKVEIEVSENLYNSLMNMNPEQLGFMERLLRIPVDVFRVGITHNPAFAVANSFVDQITATVMSQTNYVPFLDMARGIKSYVTKDKYAMGFVEHGGATAGIVSSDRKYAQMQLNNLMTTKQKMAKFKLDVKNAPLKEIAKLTVNTPYAVIKAFGDFSDILEQGTRIGVYRKAIKSGKSGNEAAYIARDSTIDFNKGGKVGRKMNQYIAFHNVAVQGIDKNFRTLKDPKARKKMIGMGIATITVPSIALYNINKDEEWYQELPTSEKNLNWHMKIGETIYRFPKPRELGVLFGSLPERMLEYVESNDKRDLKGLGGTALDLMAPPLMPTAATPIWEVARNKNFAGVPIVSPFSQSDAPIEQQDAYTSEFSKRLAELAPTKVSPKKTDHLIQGYTGSLGKTALQFSDSMFKNDTSMEKPKESGLKGSALFNRFAVKNLEGNNKFTQDFYNQWEDLKKKKQISERLGTPFNNRKYDAYKDAEKSIKELNKIKKEVLNSSISGEEKTAKLKEIGNSITQIAKGVYNFK